MKKTDETKTVPGASANHAIGKVLQLISFMAGNKSPMRLLDLSTGTGIPQATVLRYLNLLSEEGYVYLEASQPGCHDPKPFKSPLDFRRYCHSAL